MAKQDDQHDPRPFSPTTSSAPSTGLTPASDSLSLFRQRLGTKRADVGYPANTPSPTELATSPTPAHRGPEHRCEECHDIGWVKRFVGPAEWQHEPVRCQCQQTADAQARWEKARRASNMSQRLYASTFANYNGEHNGDIAYGIERWAHEPKGWVYLFGKYGRGKTHLAAAAFNVMVERSGESGAFPLYTVVPDLLDHVRAGYDQRDYGPRFEAVRRAPVLILDDLGAEKQTEWTSEVLFKLLDHRYREQLPTLLVSNLPPNTLDGRLASRVQDIHLSVVYEVTGPDYRLEAPKPKPAPGARVQALLTDGYERDGDDEGGD